MEAATPNLWQHIYYGVTAKPGIIIRGVIGVLLALYVARHQLDVNMIAIATIILPWEKAPKIYVGAWALALILQIFVRTEIPAQGDYWWLDDITHAAMLLSLTNWTRNWKWWQSILFWSTVGVAVEVLQTMTGVYRGIDVSNSGSDLISNTVGITVGLWLHAATQQTTQQ